MKPCVFFSKCKPQSADAWLIAKAHNRVFVGYPVFKKGVTDSQLDRWRELGLRSLLADISDPNFEQVAPQDLRRGYKSQVSGNRRLAQDIGAGSIVLVPRLNTGICHAGVITGSFELIDQPIWAADYLALRLSQRLKNHPREIEHIADVVQTWPVGDWTELPFAGLPRWISYRLLSRNTVGVIHDLPEPPVSAIDTVRALIDQPPSSRYSPLRPLDQIERSLLDWVSPSAFEHLIVDLLQLEAQPGIYWHHVGGSGDSGMDGIAVDSHGRICGALQCKWHSGESPAKLASQLSIVGGSDIKKHVAILLGSQEKDGSGFEFLNRSTAASLVVKHKESLPMATSIGLVQAS